MSSRQQNERKFDSWTDLPNGGRRYRYELAGRHGWKACYVKEVDAQENTIRFWQEIYDGSGQLVETHQKYPTDPGHQKAQP